MNSATIDLLDPVAAIPGGEVLLEYRARADVRLRGRLWIGGQPAHLVAAGRNRALAIVPDSKKGGVLEVTIGGTPDEEGRDDGKFLVVGQKRAEDLHPVTNPAFDPDDGSLYVTRSGGRGERLPVTLFRIDAMGELTEVSGDIANPTAIAFDQKGQMFVTSRLEGTVYRLSPFHEAVAFATSLGIATGLAFDSAGRMYVGDRSGTIYRVSGIGEAQEFTQLEPSVSAYHLAFGPDDYLYVTGPTVNSYDVITRVDPAGVASTFFRGLGRPQGLAFDNEGNLYVAASFAGRRGVVRVSPNGSNARLVVAGMNIVGLAFSASRDLIVATHDAIFSLPMGIRGALLRDAN
jgi:sugar lactone lactonase YvrE